MPYGDDAALTIVEPFVGNVDRPAGKHLGRIREVEAAFDQGPGTLSRIECDFQENYRTPKNPDGKRFYGGTENWLDRPLCDGVRSRLEIALPKFRSTRKMCRRKLKSHANV
jgi:hypothetical protein